MEPIGTHLKGFHMISKLTVMIVSVALLTTWAWRKLARMAEPAEVRAPQEN